MRFLLDQDVYGTTARLLAGLGHDVAQAAQIGLSRAPDEQLLRAAEEQDRILVTRDRDFGSLVFVRALGAGVLYLRILPSTQDAVHGELERVLDSFSQQQMRKAFIVIEPHGYRIRWLPVK